MRWRTMRKLGLMHKKGLLYMNIYSKREEQFLHYIGYRLDTDEGIT